MSEELENEKRNDVLLNRLAWNTKPLHCDGECDAHTKYACSLNLAFILSK